jgi:glucosamine-phosphate N-acetyltransferase
MTLFFDTLNNIINNFNNIDNIQINYIHLLSHLTSSSITNKEIFLENINKIHSHGIIYVCYYLKDDEIFFVASGTIIIEPKIIHGCKNVGHIEDIVVHPNYQGEGLSYKIINYLKQYGINNNCYKIILDCNKNIKKVYEKHNFVEKDIQMVYYI